MAEANASTHDEPDLIPARMVNEFVYCPRLFHLEWVQKEWADNAETLAGKFDHRRVDRETGDLPPATEAVGRSGEVRSVMLSAPAAGIVARMDLLEIEGGAVVPVDYKHGRPPRGEGELWPADRIQLGAQALVLRENGYRCDEAVAYYVKARRRVALLIDDALLDDVRNVVRRAREAASGPLPPPLVDSPKCPGCSLVGICLPDEVNLLLAEGASGLVSSNGKIVRDESSSAGTVESNEATSDAMDAEDADSDVVRSRPEKPSRVRRLYPARDDALPLYVQSAGARVGKSGDELEITDRDGNSQTVRLIDVSQVALFGNVQITASALSAVLGRETPVCHFSSGGWFHGITHGVGPRNAELRRHQFRLAADPAACLDLARGFVFRKIKNGRVLLRRNAETVADATLDELDRSADSALRAGELATLLGIEGAAARAYFGAFAAMLKADHSGTFDLEGRNRRPPRDPINALLSLAYSVLSRDWTIALLAVGLDPFQGFYHQPRYGRAALALDLMEEFRPLVADSVVIQLVNNGEIQPRDFIRRGPGVALTDEGRRKFFLAYERRMSHEVTHPLFGYQVSYRRLLEVQSRLFGRHLAGELPRYDGFRTR